MSSNTKLVWSDDPKDKAKLDGENSAKKSVANAPVGGTWTAVFRLEKGGRGGKTVTVIDKLPANEMFLKDLCKELKNKCGSGGTYRIEGDGLIEIQGEKHKQIKVIFDQKGIRYKGL